MDTAEAWDQDDGYQLTTTQNSKFGHFFTHLLDHDHDDLISEQDFEALIEVTGKSRSRCHVVYQKCSMFSACMHHWINRGFDILPIGPRIRPNLIFCGRWKRVLWILFWVMLLMRS